MQIIQKTPAGWQAGQFGIYPTRARAREAVREIKRAQREAGARVIDRAHRRAVEAAFNRRLSARK